MYTVQYCIPTIGPPILLQENMLTDPGNIYRNMNVKIGTVAVVNYIYEDDKLGML
jgi:hypothetical protein